MHDGAAAGDDLFWLDNAVRQLVLRLLAGRRMDLAARSWNAGWEQKGKKPFCGKQSSIEAFQSRLTREQEVNFQLRNSEVSRMMAFSLGARSSVG